MAPRSKRREPSRLRLPLWAVGVLAIVVVALIGSSGLWLFKTVQRVAAGWELGQPGFAPAEGGEATRPASAAEAATLNGDSPVAPILSAEAIKPWPGHDRVTLLLLGIDQRCDEEGPTRTDSMMVLTLDPVGLSAAALSLPRDLWVEVPGFGVDRINRAHYLGQIYQYPGGGPALATETVAATLGIKIDYYATVDFNGFVQAIDEIGGIDIDVPEPIDDSTYPDNCYGYDPLYLQAGRQHMDGTLALKYARTRATLGGDVDRAGRQQQVLLAVRDKVLRLNMLPQLIARSPQLWQTFQQSVRTNLSLDEAIQLAALAQDIPRDSIRTAVINYDYVYAQTTPDGQQVLVPIRENIRALRDQLFTPPVVPTPVIEDLPALALHEQARIALLNGTPTFGLAAATQTYLQSFGLQVTEIGNADSSTYRTTQVIDYGEHNYTTLYLTQLLSLPPLNINSGSEAEGDYDILVVIGNDWNVPAP